MTKKDAERKIPKLIAQLRRQYGKTSPPEPTLEPIEHLVLLVLIEHTSERRAERALKQLCERFVDWNEVRVSAAFEIGEAIKDVEGSSAKAERVRRILEGLFTKQNSLALDDLDDMPPEKALRYLLSIDGMQWQDAAQFVLLHYDHPALPVDASVARLASRIGLCTKGTSVQDTRKTLEPLVPKRSMWEFFHLFQLHAENACTQEDYECTKCTLAKECETHKLSVGSAAKKKRTSARKPAPKPKSARKRGTTAGRAGKKPARRSP